MSARNVATAVALGLLALVIGSELVLRFGLGLGNPILIQADQACGYIIKPDQDVVRFFDHTHINHEGMRSAEIPPVRDPGALRIMFVGDSMTYGTSRLNQKNLFTEIIHHRLPDLVHRPVEVLNASASAWAPDNEWAYVRSRGTFNSDWVVLVLNSGDLTQPRSTMADVGDDLPSKRPASAWAELYTRLIGPRLFHIAPKTDAGIGVRPDADSVVRSNLADIEQLYTFVRQNRARLMIVYLPARSDIPRQSAPSQSILKDWAARHDVKLLDLTSVETAYPSKQITLDGVHLNKFGHVQIADAILKMWPG